MTRTLKLSAMALLGVMILWACGGENLGAKETAEKFLKAMKAQDFSTAKKYATAKSGESIDLVAGMSQGQPAGDPSAIVIGEVEENGDNAVVNYTEDGKDMTLKLVKESGTWKAVWSKTDGASDAAGDALGGAMDDLGNAMEDALNELGGDEEGSMDEEPAEEDHSGHDH